MAQQDLSSFRIPDKDMEEIKGAIAALKIKLLPRLRVLTPAGRKEIAKEGKKIAAFVRKILEYHRSDTRLCRKLFDMESLGMGVKSVESLYSIQQPLLQILEALNDTILLSASETYAKSLQVSKHPKSSCGDAGEQAK